MGFSCKFSIDKKRLIHAIESSWGNATEQQHVPFNQMKDKGVGTGTASIVRYTDHSLKDSDQGPLGQFSLVWAPG